MVKIGGIKYKIEYSKDLTRDRGNLGECCCNTSVIRLDSDLGFHMEKKTLLHEIIEAINFEYEMKLEHTKISILETALYQIIIDNKELIKTFWKERM